jgi:uncharacterized protein (DUF779 family)
MFILFFRGGECLDVSHMCFGHRQVLQVDKDISEGSAASIFVVKLTVKWVG